MNLRRSFFVFAVPVLVLLQTVTAPAVVFTNDATISAFDKSYENDSVVVSNCTVTVDSVHSFASLLVGPGGTLTHTFSGNGMINVPASVSNESVTLTDTNAVALAVGGTLLSNRVVDASNFVTYVETVDYEVTFQGSTVLINRTTNSAIPDGGMVLVSYDLSVTAPAGMTLTLAGNLDVLAGAAINVNAKGYAGGQGAGAGGTAGTTLSGAGGGHGGYGGLSVSNAPGGNCYGIYNAPTTLGSGGGQGASGPGANGGGAIKLVAGGVATIDGAISANGLGATNSRSGGGAGGSVWISAGTVNGGGSITVNGGAGEPIFGGGGGGGRLVVTGNGGSFNGSLTAFGGAGWKYGGAGTVYKNIGAQNGLLLLDNNGRAGTNTMLSGASSSVDVMIRSNAVARLSGTLTARHLTIQSGSAVDGDALGSSPGVGLGAGTFSNTDPANRPCSGGGNGGYGGTASTNVPGGYAFGSINNSISAGGGGGTFSTLSVGGSGGGLLVFNLSGTLSNDGKISANGGNGSGNGGGGGAGGGISITANALIGAGSITANGGTGANNIGGGGGGGRIYISAFSNVFTGTLTAFGGTGSGIGGAGSIYSFLGSVGFGPPRYLVDNGGRAGTNTPVNIGESYTDYIFRSNAIVVPTYTSCYAKSITVVTNSSLVFTGINIAAVFTVNDKVTVDATSSIVADGAGFSAATGTGLGGNYGGGGHGGAGGSGNTNALGGVSYGSITSPSTYGSGGGNANFNSATPGGAGGGALRFSLPGDFTLNGKLSTSGRDSALGGGGAGGSVWISAGRLLGSGSIMANGGSCLGPIGGGGGGGRIALSATTNSFTGSITAYGGIGFVRGGAGTIYRQTPLVPPAGGYSYQLLLDNGGVMGTNTPINTSFGSPTPDLVVSNGAMAFINSPSSIFANLIVGSNAAVRLSVYSLTVSSAAIAPGGSVNSDGLANSFGTGQGGSQFISSSPSSVYYGGGGGYGGYGGNGGAVNARGGASFITGSTTSPTGSGGPGGGSGSSFAPFGGLGGGALRLTVNGALTNNGRISSDGKIGSGNCAGGGAGGSVWVSSTTLAGSGLFSANGGSGILPGGGGGGGGRISVTYNSSTFSGSMTAYGGSGFNYGGAGTVHSKSNFASYGTLVVDNGGNNGTNTTYDFSFGADLTVSGGGRLVMLSGSSSLHNLLIKTNGLFLAPTSTSPQTLTINGTATIDAGGVFALDGTGYGPSSGPGAGYSTLPGAKGGGGHGGYGSLAVANGGNAYDSITTPQTAGSGGGNGSGSGGIAPYGGSGGGALNLSVSQGTLTVNGRLSANGLAGDLNSGGGSGGSLSLNLGTLLGSGVISSKGGAGNGTAGGGAGGRIAVTYSSNGFSGTISASAGNGSVAGGAGTVYLKPGSASVGQLLIDNAGLLGTNTPLSTSFAVPALPFNLIISGGAAAMPITPLPLLSNITVTTGGLLTSRPNETNLMLAVLRDVTIGAGSAIAVDGKGLGRGAGTGLGATLSGKGAGGGYGGIGGNSQSGAVGGTNYGSATQPVDRGSGGGAGANTYINGCEGGGAIRMSVGGTLAVNGTLSANGNPGLQDDSGGGSGGSVWIKTSSLTGGGTVSANGGDGELLGGGGGGGGRVAIYSPANSFAGFTNVNGGYGANSGQPGTVFTSSVLDAFQVVTSSPTGVVNTTVSSVDLNFNEIVAPASVSAANFNLFTPNGLLPQVNLSASVVGLSTVRVSFPLQNTVGDYRLEAASVQDIFGQSMTQPFTNSFTLALPVISGTVTNAGGQPVSGVTIQSSGLPDTATDVNGNYSVGVPSGWTGTVTPSFGTNMFVPGVYSYSGLSSPASNQNFLMVATISPTLGSGLSGTNLSLTWSGIPGVTYQPYSSTNLVDWTPLGGPLPGTNGLMQLLVPANDPPMQFLRLQATN